MSGYAFGSVEVQPEASTSTRNPFRTPQHNSQGRPGSSTLATQTTNPTSNLPRTPSMLSDASNFAFYAPSQFDQAGESIVRIYNQPSYRPSPEDQGASSLPMVSSQPHVDPIPGSNAVERPVDIYTKLMCQGHGFPLWNPKPPDDLPEQYIIGGVRIGDVGVITSEGVFDYAFNIYLEAEDPVNFGRTPPNFEPLRTHPSICLDRNAWGARSCVASPGIRSTLDTGGRFVFECGVCKGAMLALPHGACRQDARDLPNLREYATKYAVGWYRYLITDLRREVSNGSLYLITGCDKTSTWGTGGFNTGSQRNFRMVFSPGQNGMGSTLGWDESGYAGTKFGQSTSSGQRNQCIFLRGYRATLQPRFWAEISYEVEITSLLEASRISTSYLSRCMSYLSTYIWFLAYFRLEETLKRSLLDVKTSGLKIDNQPVYPSEVIGLDLLERIPDAKLALIHDSTYRWPDFAENDLAPSKSDILSQVYEENNIHRQGDVIWLSEECLDQNPSSRLLSIFGQLWRSSVQGKIITQASSQREYILASETPEISLIESPSLNHPSQDPAVGHISHFPEKTPRHAESTDSSTLVSSGVSTSRLTTLGLDLSHDDHSPKKSSYAHAGNLTERQLGYLYQAPGRVTRGEISSIDDDFLESDCDRYSRILMSKACGFPLWHPQPPGDSPPEYRRRGVTIGDVGVITPDGIFDTFFNITLPADHPINLYYGVPDGFQTLQTSSSDIRVIKQCWKDWSYIASNSVVRSPVSSNKGSVMYQFGCPQEEEGAILVLPAGAYREDVLNLGQWQEYAHSHGHSWYRFINGVLGREVLNGSIQLVTGCDKTTCWGNASFPKALRPGPFEMTFQGLIEDPPGQACRFNGEWLNPGFSISNSGTSWELDENGEPARNQCIFVRGLSTSLPMNLWALFSNRVEVARFSGKSTIIDRRGAGCIPYSGKPTGSWWSRLMWSGSGRGDAH